MNDFNIRRKVLFLFHGRKLARRSSLWLSALLGQSPPAPLQAPSSSGGHRPEGTTIDVERFLGDLPVVQPAEHHHLTDRLVLVGSGTRRSKKTENALRALFGRARSPRHRTGDAITEHDHEHGRLAPFKRPWTRSDNHLRSSNGWPRPHGGTDSKTARLVDWITRRLL